MRSACNLSPLLIKWIILVGVERCQICRRGASRMPICNLALRDRAAPAVGFPIDPGSATLVHINRHVRGLGGAAERRARAGGRSRAAMSDAARTTAAAMIWITVTTDRLNV